MKKYWIVMVSLGIMLLVSVAANGWFMGTIQAYRYNVNRNWFEYTGHSPEYPVGVTAKEINKILDDIISYEHNEDVYIIDITVYDKNHIYITTGISYTGMSGSGCNYSIERTKDGWKITSKSNWIS